MEVWTTSGLDRAYFLCGALSQGKVQDGSVDYIRTGPNLLPVWIHISRYSKGRKCELHDGLDRAYFLYGSLSSGIVKEGSVDYIRTGPSLLPVWATISRYSTGWKCGLHPDWTELTSCVDPYLKVQ